MVPDFCGTLRITLKISRKCKLEVAVFVSPDYCSFKLEIRISHNLGRRWRGRPPESYRLEGGKEVEYIVQFETI